MTVATRQIDHEAWSQRRYLAWLEVQPETLHLAFDGADRLEAALARRRDRMSPHLERIERHVHISNEALAVFVRFWLTSTPALPEAALAAAQTKGRERYEGFVEALGRRLARGRKLADEVISEVSPSGGDAGTHNEPDGAANKGDP